MFGYEWERVGMTNGNNKLGTPLISILRILQLDEVFDRRDGVKYSL